MRKVTHTTLSTALIIIALTGASLSGHAKTTLRVTLQLPLSHHLGQNLIEFKKQVEEKSLGELEIKIFDAAKLYKDQQVPQAVSSGAIEMGIASLSQFSDNVPTVDVFSLPFIFDSPPKIRAATAPGSAIRKNLDGGILKTGARVLWWQAFGSAIILSKNRPINFPAHIKGKKVRVFGKPLSDMVKALGGRPIQISGSTQYQAYQQGTLDAGLTGITTVKSRKLYEVMKHMTLTRHTDIEFVVIINEKIWQGLTENNRKIINEAALRVEQRLRNKMNSIESAALEAISDKIAIIDLTRDERAEWKAATKPVVDAFIKRAGKAGAAIVKAAKQLK